MIPAVRPRAYSIMYRARTQPNSALPAISPAKKDALVLGRIEVVPQLVGGGPQVSLEGAGRVVAVGRDRRIDFGHARRADRRPWRPTPQRSRYLPPRPRCQTRSPSSTAWLVARAAGKIETSRGDRLHPPGKVKTSPGSRPPTAEEAENLSRRPRPPAGEGRYLSRRSPPTRRGR